MDKKILDAVMKKIKVLHIKQGDILVTKVPSDIAPDMKNMLKSAMLIACEHYKKMCGKDIFFVLISDNIDVAKIEVRRVKGGE